MSLSVDVLCVSKALIIHLLRGTVPSLVLHMHIDLMKVAAPLGDPASYSKVQEDSNSSLFMHLRPTPGV